MELSEAIRTRRSVRKFKPSPVPREVLQRIIAAGVEAPTGCNLHLIQYIIVDDAGLLDLMRPMSRALVGAQAVIVILVQPCETKYGEFWMQDASAAMENMLLAAVDAGYAACWVEGALRRCEDQLRTMLAVPENLRIWSLLPVGLPAETPDRPEKPDPESITHYNTFGKK